MTTQPRFVNCTPHEITVLNDVGELVLSPSGIIPRVSQSPLVPAMTIMGVQMLQGGEFGEVEGLPAPEEGVLYVVSGMVFGATDRKDVVAPATDPANVIRNDKGHVIGVRAFRMK